MSRPIRHSDEQDAYTRWREVTAYLQRSGAVKAIKRRTHKRERREAQRLIKKEQE